MVDRYTEWADWTGWADERADKRPCQRAGRTRRTGTTTFAKVRVAGSNPVVRSNRPWSESLLRAADSLVLPTCPRNPATGRRLDRSITVRGDRGDAERELAEMVARIRCVRAVGSRSTMSELFEAWFVTAVDGWSPSTVRQNRSVLDCHLHRHIGSVVVGDATPALIDALYVRLLAATTARDGWRQQRWRESTS